MFFFGNRLSDNDAKLAASLASKLRQWNTAVATVHFTSFLVLLVITLLNLDRALMLRLWTDFNGAIQDRGSFPIAASLLPFPALTALAHLAQLLDIASYFRLSLIDGVTPHRWVEYSVTNGFITWSIFTLSGAGNILTLVTALLLNVLMQLFGYLHERANSGVSVDKRSLTFLWLGFLPWLPLWITPLVSYSQLPANTPLYYGFAIIGSFVLSIGFTLPLFYRYLTRDPELIANYKTELAYLLLSLSAKLYLDWVVTVGNLLATASVVAALVLN
jgi:hypothetical protein